MQDTAEVPATALAALASEVLVRYLEPHRVWVGERVVINTGEGKPEERQRSETQIPYTGSFSFG